ncbi:MAG: phosphoribosylaminoimidazolesuccinocarboxamide synthase [Candidatus Thorarchaeota archaeon]|jgi:phosphoribosylaminoimidazole-succinocarboxamide synthase
MDLIHEGKVKKVYQDPESSDRVVIEFTDIVTAGDGKKREEIEGKGELTCRMTEYLLGYLEGKGIDTHFVRTLEGPQILARKVDIYPVEVVCRNIAAGSFCRRYGVEKGRALEKPLVEFFLKADSLHDPLITEEAITSLGLVTYENLQFMRSVVLSANYYLTELLKQQELTLVDFKLEFGCTEAGHIVVADELSGDTMRVWDNESSSLDKDVFREDKGGLVEVYTKLVDSLTGAKPEEVANRKEIVQVIVKPKVGIKNPPGEVTKKALVRLGFGDAEEVRVGKIFNILLRKPVTSEILNQLNIMNIKLLSNPISEKHEVSFD